MTKKNLEQIVQKARVKKDNEPQKVYVLTELGYDTHYFNEEAYQNLLKYIAKDPEVSGIILDGALTRLDRPEYLNDDLTYWNKSEEEGRKETRDIRNRMQYATMMDRQFELLEKRFKELRKTAPKTKIVYSLDSDDFQFTTSAMINEALLNNIQEIENRITHLKERRTEFQSEIGYTKRDISSLKKQKGTGRKRAGLTKRIDNLEKKLLSIDEELNENYSEKRLYREKKARPSHQIFTREFLKNLYLRYQTLCDSYDIELVKSQSVLDFGNLRIDYAHSRHSTWSPIKSRDKKLAESLHGKLEDYLERGIDVILESGHHGIGYKRLQKVKDSPEETNFKNQNSYNPDISDETITIALALPFEDQEKISKFLRGKESIRISAGKPISTRKHAVIDRLKNDGVSGVTVISKDNEEIIGTEWIQYQNFVDGSVLKEPREYALITASSDEHIGSPEENPIVREGMILQHIDLLTIPKSIRGKEAYARGYISAGDTGEANSRKWDHRYHHREKADVFVDQVVSLLGKKASLDETVGIISELANYTRQGSVEDMSVILEWVADYYEAFFWPTIEKSSLKWAHLSVPGNHSDGVLRDLGLRESDFFVQRLKSKGIDVYEVGKRDFDSTIREKAQAFIGGYSNARILQVEDYGAAIKGKPLFGPINLILQHDPKGSNGLVGAGRNVKADLALAGHTHETYVKIYNTGANQFGVGYRLGTLQGVTPTEKYYASSLPRTQSGHRFIMPMNGQFWEQSLPASYLQKKGYQRLLEKIERKKTA